MKIIHTADLHLDSRLSANLPADKRKIRKAEVLRSFARLCEYAAANEVEAVLIAGDLFDNAAVSRAARDAVLAAVKGAPGVQFYYLRGNHDEGGALTGSLSAGNGDASGTFPANLHLFESRWTSYILEPSGSVVLYGAELGAFSGTAAAAGFVADESKINIVMLHGQEVLSASAPEDIPIKAFKNKGIDYLALGHIHSFKEGQIDGRGTYAYPGALEGRGFDECGPKGFIVLDIDIEKKKIERTFVPFALRTLYTVEADVSGAADSGAALEISRRAVAATGAKETDLIKLVLTGETEGDIGFDTDYICAALSEDFFFVKMSDKTRLAFNEASFAGDISLRGEFVRKVLASGLTDEEKAKVVRCGLLALSGEEVLQ